jgi:hypothetical protein
MAAPKDHPLLEGRAEPQWLFAVGGPIGSYTVSPRRESSCSIRRLELIGIGVLANTDWFDLGLIQVQLDK